MLMRTGVIIRIMGWENEFELCPKNKGYYRLYIYIQKGIKVF
jgi:hypothetical protein